MGLCENIKAAVSITDYAERSGYTLVRKGKYYSLREHDSVMIDTDKNCFWRNSRFQRGQKGSAGSVIDFAIEFNGAKDVKEAAKWIADLYGIEGDREPKVPVRKPVAAAPQEKLPQKRGAVMLPEKDSDNRRVFAYLLKNRCIDQSVIRYFIGKKMLYQEKEHKNCVFHTGTTFGCVRGTDPGKRFIGDLEGCDYDECFFIRPNEKANTLIVAESVIDIMSIMTQMVKEGKRYTDYSYLAVAGTGKLPSLFIHLAKEPKISAVILAFDNDEAGQKVTRIAEGGLVESGFNGRYAIAAAPSGKDWNEYVQEQRNVEPTTAVLTPVLNRVAGR